MPTSAERKALEARRNHIVDGLRPADPINVVEVILAMFDAWPNVRMDASKAKGVAVAYCDQVNDCPFWAIEAGARTCQGCNDPFPPSAGMLKAACLEHMATFETELASIHKVLNADVLRPGKSAEAIDCVRAVAKSFGSVSAANKRQAADYRDDPREAAEWRLGNMDYADRPLTLSPAALATMRPLTEHD